MRERLLATLHKQRFDKDEHGHGSYKRGESGDVKHDESTKDATPVPSIAVKADGDAHTGAGTLPGFPHGSPASGTHQYTVLDHQGNEVSHHDAWKDAATACKSCATTTGQPSDVRDNTGASGNKDSGLFMMQFPKPQGPDPVGRGDTAGMQYFQAHPYAAPTYVTGTPYSDTRAAQVRRALADLATGEGDASGASMDDANGDRGDVAPPAIHMPRSMSSRCMSCGKDMSVRDLKTGGAHCQEHADTGADELHTPAPHLVPRPGGSITKPRLPMEKDGAHGDATALDAEDTTNRPRVKGPIKAIVNQHDPWD